MRMLAALFAVTTAAATPAFAAMPIAGRWITADRAALVDVGRCGTSVCGRLSRIIVAGSDGAILDVHNSLPTLRHRPLLGLPILTGFVESGDEWRGRIYDPRNGKTYKSIVTRQVDGTLKVQGCIAFFCQTQVWKRAS